MGIKEKIVSSPFIKTIISVSSIIISGILCGIFVAEITINGTIQIRCFYKTYSFYCLFIYIIMVYLYYRFLYVAENKILDFKDIDYCNAYVKSKCLPALTERYAELIKNGKSIELREISINIKELIG